MASQHTYVDESLISTLRRYYNRDVPLETLCRWAMRELACSLESDEVGIVLPPAVPPASGTIRVNLDPRTREELADLAACRAHYGTSAGAMRAALQHFADLAVEAERQEVEGLGPWAAAL